MGLGSLEEERAVVFVPPELGEGICIANSQRMDSWI